MFLYSFGFKYLNKSRHRCARLSDYFREGQKFRTRKIEYESILKNTSNEVVDTFKGQTMPRRSYTKYSDEECANIGRYTFEKGNE